MRSAIELRVVALEARVADIEDSHGDTLYELRRAAVKSDLRMAKMLDALSVEDVTEQEIDAVLDGD